MVNGECSWVETVSTGANTNSSSIIVVIDIATKTECNVPIYIALIVVAHILPCIDYYRQLSVTMHHYYYELMIQHPTP